MALVGEIIRMTLKYSALNTSEMQNIFHFEVDVADNTDTDILNILDSFTSNFWAPAWEDLASENVNLDEAQVDVVSDTGTVVRAIGAFAIQAVGAVTGSQTAAAVAAYMLLNTAFPKVQGVKYLPGLAEGIIQDGALNATGLAALAFCLIQYAKTLESSGASELVPGVLSKSKSGFVPFVDTGLIETIPAYQRRRKPSVGI